MKEIVLASASPRRKELLKMLGLNFRIEASELAEEEAPELKPKELVRYLSRAKARRVSEKYPGAIIIAADTTGALRGKVIGKPGDAESARRMLHELSGKTHQVITGFTILDTETGKILTRTVETEVTMRRLSRREIDSYVATGEPLDKAGAYAIQGLGATLVREIRGDFYSVVGLPLSALTTALKRYGVYVTAAATKRAASSPAT